MKPTRKDKFAKFQTFLLVGALKKVLKLDNQTYYHD